MKAILTNAILAVCLTFFTHTALAQAPADTILVIEQPTINSTYTGVANLRGWAVSINGIDHIELFVDGTLKSNIPSGSLRTDVGSAYPTYPGSDQSGFSMAFNYSDLTPGQHTMLIRAVDTRGNAKAETISFFTVHFDVPGNFLTDPNKVSLKSAIVGVGPNGRSISIKNLQVDGKPYTVLLDWNTGSQDFTITQLSSPDRKSVV